ncbi:NAD(P)H-binding protein [Streptomyces lunaelactis]|uniref:SDR family oxidoreductase n=1 Tax=Streptomyces lunaelactis TaxID=1535768 RepID=UPI00158489FB|nr:NAD(P)H-binding protein [Streptomyces lunaelactis]NUL07136.1 NAD(P)H-binding protein [Streptomyces lunaelactis]
MRIAIAGGTGTLGRQVADELRSRGHEVRVLSRRSPEYRVDLTTGDGLDEALVGCDVVVDASNNQTSTKDAARTLVEGSRRLLAAEDAAGVRHHVCVSIVGCDQVPMGYFKVKTEQEGVVEAGPVPWTVVRATQFHELMDMVFTKGARWRVLPVPRARLQTVASADAARAVADVAEAAPRRGRVEVTGPETVDARALARRWRSITGRRALLLPLPLPGKAGRALRAGVATSERPDVRGTVPFDDWLRDAVATRSRTSGPGADHGKRGSGDGTP